MELAGGAVDGVNRDFTVAADYRSGSVLVLVNGLARERTNTADGWVELPPRTIRLHEAPRTGEVVQVQYAPI